MKSHKKKHRIENPDEYASDDSLSSLFNEGEPRRMFGRLAKNKETGESYKIPSLEQIIKILQDGMKTSEEIVDILIPHHIDIKDQICAMAIMKENKLLTEQMIQKIKRRDDKLSEYVNFISGQRAFDKSGHGALSSVNMLTKGATRHFQDGFFDYVGFCDNGSARVANSLVSKLKYFQKCKKCINPSLKEALKKDPHFIYFE